MRTNITTRYSSWIITFTGNDSSFVTKGTKILAQTGVQALDLYFKVDGTSIEKLKKRHKEIFIRESDTHASLYLRSEEGSIGCWVANQDIL